MCQLCMFTQANYWVGQMHCGPTNQHIFWVGHETHDPPGPPCSALPHVINCNAVKTNIKVHGHSCTQLMHHEFWDRSSRSRDQTKFGHKRRVFRGKLYMKSRLGEHCHLQLVKFKRMRIAYSVEVIAEAVKITMPCINAYNSTSC